MHYCGVVSAQGALQLTLLEEVRAVIGGGSLANDAALTREDGEWTVHGDPTEAAFLVAVNRVAETMQIRGLFP